ncbi:unnamed protein product [Musa acuminata var. zebrina]
MTPLVLPFLLVFFTIAFLLVFSTTAASNYDYFHLVLQWPGSFCNVNRCYPMCTGYPEIFFTNHGLWPAFRNGMFPSCDKNMPSASKYNQRKVCLALTHTTLS